MLEFVESVSRIVWGIPTLLLIIGVGFYLSVRTRFVQLRQLPKALRRLLQMVVNNKGKKEGVSSYRALCTALAATVGTGNIAGVAGAIALGGPGSIFWMWICGILGMVTKFAEATLAVRYRQKNAKGEYVGGSMYMIRENFPHKWHWLGSVYAFFGIVASFGVGNATQVNAIVGGINSAVTACGGTENRQLPIWIGCVMAGIIMLILLGGARRIGAIAETLVPFASIGYIVLSFVVLVCCYRRIPAAFCAIIQGAFSPKAVTGGVIGSSLIALRVGASRGVFTNEAGMGTATIAHAASDVAHPIEQGLMGIVEVFLDTIVVCSMTALAILVSGVAIPFGQDVGATLTTHAFSAVLGQWVCVPLAAALCCFAIATILGWGFYGVRCTQYLFGENAWKKFVYLQAITAIVGAILGTRTVWMLSEIVNGLMAIPNLIALAYLSPELLRLVRQYECKALQRKNLSISAEIYE